jgi:hypothetical protein
LNHTEVTAIALAVVVIIESSVIAIPLIKSLGPTPHPVGSQLTSSFGYATFNRPVTNNTEREFHPSYNGSWMISIHSTLGAASASRGSESELAFAPAYPDESKSIPTLIVQERADGLLRIEYFAQAWPSTYGLVLYNSTSPSWLGNTTVTITFLSFGPPVAINPPSAPRPNGNLTIVVGGTGVLSSYPIAWASLGDVYLYGIPGSSFVSGNLTFSVQGLSKS